MQQRTSGGRSGGSTFLRDGPDGRYLVSTVRDLSEIRLRQSSLRLQSAIGLSNKFLINGDGGCIVS